MDGQAAIITPRKVTSGLGSRRVKAIAAAKHHTVVATEGGEVFTWGSNREGQLGYPSVDTQPTPRRVSSLRSKFFSVAAANKHTAVVSETGEVFTWGCNREGQLGYGTSNSASNYTPRVVEYLKGKVFSRVAAAKYHTVVLGADGEVCTWGHRLVTPRRVVIARNLKKGGTTILKFHRMEQLHVVAVAAGMVHSVALTDDGAIFYWVSSDPDLRCQQLYSLCGRNLVSISAGKYWIAAITATGDVYMWDGKKGKDKLPVASRLHGVKRATSVSVGETHLLIVGSLYHPVYPPNVAGNPQKLKLNVRDEPEEFDEDFMFNDLESINLLSTVQKDDCGHRPIPSLKSLCEKVAAECLVEPQNAIQLLEIADSLEANDLRKHCEI
ncbi:ultraviolet-B receptor UVR8-like [Quercus lobata]|uniref:ultraviolet-B receptor UVR8-like n=1 Tax=Quercus lobata TaxID=97700 RepID=UPI0012484872|nr:ultraviolet-B receptor UVR8-like [Quercus lobata]